MNTRIKINVACIVATIMMLLYVFSKPLHIPEIYSWVLLIGVWIPLGFLFYFIKKLKSVEHSVSTDEVDFSSTDQQNREKKNGVLTMIFGSIAGLCAPFWLPLTGTSLGIGGDLAIGVFTAVIVCTIIGLRLRKSA